ncbi:hypothetical protein ASF61_20205 [Duganella sp. Leaf126]|nr:hypothetical protein ASF61_20205 [Duganella sp. Leaf126]
MLLLAGLAGCASDSMRGGANSGYTSGGSGSTSSTSGYTSSGSSGSGTAATGAGPGGGGGVPAAGTAGAGTGSSGMSGSGSADSSGMSGNAAGTGSTTQASYGVVQAIDQLPAGMGDTTGSSATSATAGGPTPYRISVRMDDGSSQSIVVDTLPSYKVGDRVRYSSGALTAY